MILDWDNARGRGAVRLAGAKSNYGPARRLLALERVTVGGGDDDKGKGEGEGADEGKDKDNHGATVAFRAETGTAIVNGRTTEPWPNGRNTMPATLSVRATSRRRASRR